MTDQCHMLRYKTSLLEELLDERGALDTPTPPYRLPHGHGRDCTRLTLHQGIDFRSEIQARSNRSMLGQGRPHYSSPISRLDQVPNDRHQLKRRSTNGIAPKPDRTLKGPGAQATTRHQLESPQSSVASPSSFNFPVMSPDVQDFDPSHNNPDLLHRQIANDLYDASHRTHFTTNLIRPQNNGIPHDPYGQQAQYAHDGSYDYTQDALRPSHSRLTSNRLGK